MAKIVYREGVHIGGPSAEDDDILMKGCFVKMPVLEQLLDMESSKCIVLGRTGSGKSAVLRFIEDTEDRTRRIKPKEFAFEYISNSNILNYVMELGCDLHVLFEYLWQHVFLCRSVQAYFDSRDAFERLIGKLQPMGHAAKYLKQYQDKFWIEQDVTMREVSETFESAINTELKSVLGSELAKIETGGGASITLTADQKRQIEGRVKRAVSAIQIRELHAAISSLNGLMDNKQKKYYLLLDDLDTDWADTSIRYQMIRSLLESIKSFREVRQIKVIAALRSDVYEKSIFSFRGDGYQPEKYKGLTSQIRWAEDDLRIVLERRINYVFREKYRTQDVKTRDVLPKEIRKSDPVHYLIDRTLRRPRDIIAFFNEILDQAAGSTEITERKISTAEGEYSKHRYEALQREWESVHPNCGKYLKMLQGRTGNIPFSEFASKDTVEDLCLELEAESIDGRVLDEVEEQSRHYAKRQQEPRRNKVATALLSTLYKMGAIELKAAKGDHFRSCFKDETYLLSEQITTDAVARVSPMLWRTLGITPNLG